MTCQPSTSRRISSTAQENVYEVSNIIEDEMDEHESNTKISTKVFTKKEEILLLKKIKEDNRLLCICKFCTMEHLTILAYRVAREKRKTYPKSWNKNQQVNQEWLEKFVERHKNEILKLSCHCKKSLFTKVLTKEDEQLLLTHLQKLAPRHGCICKNCMMKEARILAYEIAFNYKRSYPETWARDKQAGRWWQRSFEATYKAEFPKFSSVCKKKLLTKVLTEEDERLLLTQLQEMEDRHDCKCKSCRIEKVQILAYEIARKCQRNYPATWDRNEHAGRRWSYRFVARYNDKFSSVCKNKMATNSAKKSKTVLTEEDERLLLRQLQEMATRLDCNCENCMMKETRTLAYKIACEHKRKYPKAWARNEKTDQLWLEYFKATYKEKIPKFSSVCKKKKKPTVLTEKDERLLLRQLEEMETRLDCNCKNCMKKEARTLAYKIACEHKRKYPKGWAKNEQAGPFWLAYFEATYKDKFSKFSPVCKKRKTHTVLTKEDEQLLLTRLEEMENQVDCNCKNCMMKEARILAYSLAHDNKRLYPESWSRNGKAGRDWLNKFERRHKDEISKFSSDCIKNITLNPEEDAQWLETVQEIDFSLF